MISEINKLQEYLYLEMKMPPTIKSMTWNIQGTVDIEVDSFKGGREIIEKKIRKYGKKFNLEINDIYNVNDYRF